MSNEMPVNVVNGTNEAIRLARTLDLATGQSLHFKHGTCENTKNTKNTEFAIKILCV